jgi:primosomal protein N' (replication factor Y)
MEKLKIAKVIFPIELEKEFDYLVPSGIKIKKYVRVKVDFRGKKKVGIVTGFKKRSERRNLKSIIEVLDEYSLLTEENFRFAKSLSDIYPYALGEFLFSMLPPYLRRPVKTDIKQVGAKKAKASCTVFIKGKSFIKRYSLWKEKLKKKLMSGSVLICFPQVSHLEEVREILIKDFGDKINIIHSYQKDRELFINWINSRKKSIILGTRVSIFYYPADLNLLIIEEENSPYYFQEEKPFYHILDVAFMLHNIKKVELILSGDFPTISTYFLAKKKKINLYDLDNEKEEKKDIKIIDLQNSRGKIFNQFLGELIRKNLTENKKIVILWNRKGFAPVLSCSSCGYIYKCKRCSAFLKLSLKENNKGICSYCGGKEEVPLICNICKKGYIKSSGLGIERLKIILKRFFPDVKIEKWERKEEDTQIIISTSKILNSLFYNEGKEKFDVGFVLDVDLFLSRLDYEAAFRAFIYLKKISIFSKESVYIFTKNKKHYLFEYLKKEWKDFYDKELLFRKEVDLPPFGSVAKIILRAKNKNRLLTKCEKLYNKFKREKLSIYGPFEEYPFKLRDKFRYSLIIKSKRNRLLRKLIKRKIKDLRKSHLKLAIVIK